MNNILVTRPRERVMLITLNRPKALNALSKALLVEVAAALDAAAKDDETRCVVITGDRRAFSAGADIKEELDEEGGIQRMQLFADLYDAIVQFPKPTLTACHGYTVGGGAEIAICSDIRIGGSNLQMRFPGAALGVPVLKLPSTSPANASWSFERKLAAWREAFDAHGIA